MSFGQKMAKDRATKLTQIILEEEFIVNSADVQCKTTIETVNPGGEEIDPP